jgi:hypothetical protein
MNFKSASGFTSALCEQKSESMLVPDVEQYRQSTTRPSSNLKQMDGLINKGTKTQPLHKHTEPDFNVSRH